MKAALFDLDGVVFDTESQYTKFWGGQCRKYRPDMPGLEHTIKGQTLTQILDSFFSTPDLLERQKDIVAELDAFEQRMEFCYVKGFESFVSQLRAHGVKTAVVTSSNRAKMEQVYRQRTEFRTLMDEILTSEDFAESKPHPDCYLKAAARFAARPEECVVFEDSLNGLRAGRASGAWVVGLATTHSPERLKDLADEVWMDFDRRIDN